MNTPWGKSDHAKRYGSGSASLYVMFYSTPSHGGFLVTADMLARMPEGLRDIKTFVGENSIGKWYEEDCDWAIVSLAFPYLFRPQDILAAVETGNRVWKGYDGKPDELGTPVVWAWLRTSEAAGVCQIAAVYERDNAQKFRKGCESTDGNGWSVSAHNIAGDREVELFFPNKACRDVGSGFYAMPEPFTLEDVAKAGGRVVKAV